jgi:DNA-binding LytR/AlgR family response regulator
LGVGGINKVGGPALNVLIVEDEAIVALELELAVSDAGHHVAGVAGDRSEANQIAAGAGVDIALVDINLRDGRTGVDIASDLSRAYGTAVIFLTANPDQVPAGFADALGVYPKPYDIEAVTGLLRFAADVRAGVYRGIPPRRFLIADWLTRRRT